MILKNKIIILLSIIIVFLIVVLGYDFFKDTKNNKEVNNNINKNEELVPKKEIQDDYSWNGIYSNGKIDITICRFDGYAFVYNTNDSGIRIFGVKDENTIEFGTQYKMNITKENNDIVISGDKAFSHYEGVYNKRVFDNTWSGDYYLNDIDLRLRQVDVDKVFYRIIRTDENKEYYDFATINESNDLIFNISGQEFIIRRKGGNIELNIENYNSNFFFGNISGTYNEK